ncbi:hypothetical protein [Streptacidiphilus fuscans]|uniref:Uncharacterized protein n=1 Tax=Streptacidiphilus fuscans TaxID=2789292 RepID=A0A931FI89_9ACTN|nr:hypothetical protein [Streptacidiphilus fuscans]MBF9072651.1 hypothetical protein [Streptacidiphilus fuscans]
MTRSAGLLAAAGLLVAGLGATAPAAQALTRATAVAAPSAAGNLYESVAHVPTSVKRGQSIVFPIWFMQRSPDNMQVLADGLRVANGSSTGVQVSWLDPATNRWEASTGNWGTADSHYLQLPSASHLLYSSGYWGHVFVRITFTSRAPLGSWYVAPNAPYEYQMWTKSGQTVANGFLNEPVTPTGARVTVHA